MYKNKTIVGSIIALIILILFTVTFAIIRGRADESDYNSFEAVTGLAGLIVAIVSAIYVYNAYTSQKELISIQKKEIEDNRKELEKSRQDAEFTRTLDVLYRQFEFTNQKHLTNRDNEDGLIKLHKKLQSYLNAVNSVWSENPPNRITAIINQSFIFTQSIRSDLLIYEMIVFSNNLTKENISVMITMVRTNYMTSLDNFFYILDAMDIFIGRIDVEELRRILKDFTFNQEFIYKTIENVENVQDNIKFIKDALDEYLTDTDIMDIRRELYD